MTAGIIAAAAGAAAARALENLLLAFRTADATGPTRARSLSDLGVPPSPTLTQLQRAAVIKPGRERDTWYLDEAALSVYRGKQRRWVVVAAVLGAVLAFAMAALFLLTARGN